MRTDGSRHTVTVRFGIYSVTDSVNHSVSYTVAVKIDTADELRQVIASLRRRGGDSATVELKSARHGLPKDLPRTLSAFANMPSGGTIILGVDEKNDLRIHGVEDIAVVEAGVASMARTVVEPAITTDMTTIDVDGASVLVVQVIGLPIVDKPAKVKGVAYLRQSDGDYAMVDNELRMIEVAKLHAHEAIHYDMRPVSGSSLEELDRQICADFLARVREEIARLAQVKNDAELLQLVQVVNSSGELTLAGNYALGWYPQGADPALAVTVAERLAENPQGDRTRDLERFEGPVPILLDQVMAWIRRHLGRTQRMSMIGEMRDEYEIPLPAVREAVANALVHRDLGPDTLGSGRAIDIRLTPDALVVTSPGGLKGVTVEALRGRDISRREVNQRLYRIARHLRTPDGARIIEGEGGGIWEILRLSQQAGLETPDLIDNGVQFTVKFWRPAGDPVPQKTPVRAIPQSHPAEKSRDYSHITRNAPHIVAVLAEADEPLSFAQITTRSGLKEGQVRYALRALIEAGAVAMIGRQGLRDTTYSLV